MIDASNYALTWTNAGVACACRIVGTDDASASAGLTGGINVTDEAASVAMAPATAFGDETTFDLQVQDSCLAWITIATTSVFNS